MRRLALSALIWALIAPVAVSAEPMGAPFSHDGAPGRPDCTSCHFDGDAVQQSAALRLEGAPARIAVGEQYSLELVYSGDASAAGFVLSAWIDGAPAGAFENPGDGLHASGASIRSEQPRERQGDSIRWRFSWRAPAAITCKCAPVFYIALNAANMDASPFGDTIYVSAFSGNAD